MCNNDGSRAQARGAAAPTRTDYIEPGASNTFEYGLNAFLLVGQRAVGGGEDRVSRKQSTFRRDPPECIKLIVWTGLHTNTKTLAYRDPIRSNFHEYVARPKASACDGWGG